MKNRSAHLCSLPANIRTGSTATRTPSVGTVQLPTQAFFRFPTPDRTKRNQKSQHKANTTELKCLAAGDMLENRVCQQGLIRRANRELSTRQANQIVCRSNSNIIHLTTNSRGSIVAPPQIKAEVYPPSGLRRSRHSTHIPTHVEGGSTARSTYPVMTVFSIPKHKPRHRIPHIPTTYDEVFHARFSRESVPLVQRITQMAQSHRGEPSSIALLQSGHFPGRAMYSCVNWNCSSSWVLVIEQS